MQKWSVIIPVFNDFKNLELALKSIYKQDIFNKDFIKYEIIVIDDASEEHAFNLFYNKFKNKKDVTIIKSNHNKGPAAARNKGLNVAKGDYITFLDSDDQWPENRTSLFLDCFNENKNIDVIFSNTKMFIQEGINHKYKNSEIIKEILMGSMAYKNNKLTAKIRFKEELRYGEDLDFWMQLKDVKAKIIEVADVGLHRYIHGKNMTLDKNFEPKKVLLNIIKQRLKK